MGIKLSELDEQTIVNNTDLMHIRTVGGLDKKVTIANSRSIPLLVHDNVVAGDPIVYRPGGRYKKAASIINWSSQQLTDIGTGVGSLQLTKITATKYLAIADDSTATARYLRPIIITLNEDDSLTIGSTGPSANSDANLANPRKVLRLDDDHFLLVHNTGSSNGYARAIVGIISGTSVSWGTGLNISSTATNSWVTQPMLWSEDASYWYVLCGWIKATSNTINYIRLLKIAKSDGTITLGTEYSPDGTNNTMYMSFGKWSYFNGTYDYGFVYYMNQTGAQFVVRRFLVDTGALTITMAGAQNIVATSGTTFYGGWDNAWLVGNQHIIFGIMGSGFPGYMITIPSEGTINEITQAECSPYGYGSVSLAHIVDDKKILSVYGSTRMYSVKCFYHDYYRNEHDILNIDISGDVSCCLVDKARAIAHMRQATTFDYYIGLWDFDPYFIGIAAASISSGSVGPVIISGLADGFSSLISGNDYWLKADGTIGAYSPNDQSFVRGIRIGKAVSTTQILLSGDY